MDRRSRSAKILPEAADRPGGTDVPKILYAMDSGVCITGS